MYPVKIFDSKGKLKIVVSGEVCCHRFWQKLGSGMNNEFTGANITNAERGNVPRSIKCIRCGKEASKKAANALYCSAYCRNTSTKKRLAAERLAKTKPRKCASCGKEFRSPRSGSRYCNAPCIAPCYQRKPLILRDCVECGKQFKAKNNQKRCSEACGLNQGGISRS